MADIFPESLSSVSTDTRLSQSEQSDIENTDSEAVVYSIPEFVSEEVVLTQPNTTDPEAEFMRYKNVRDNFYRTQLSENWIGKEESDPVDYEVEEIMEKQP